MLAIETALGSSRATVHSQTLKAILEKLGNIKPIVSDHKKKINDIRLYLSELASFELKNNTKLSLSEYRIKFTNKFYTKGTEVLDAKGIIANLNKVFDIFADNVFMGYNVPIDIPIQGTSLIFRDTIDFLLTDEESNIFAVELVDLTEAKLLKQRLLHWAHYHTQYSFLAASFDKDIDVILIDPVTATKLALVYKPEKFDQDLKDFKLLAQPMQHNNLVKNLHMCPMCEYNKYCH